MNRLFVHHHHNHHRMTNVTDTIKALRAAEVDSPDTGQSGRFLLRKPSRSLDSSYSVRVVGTETRQNANKKEYTVYIISVTDKANDQVSSFCAKNII
jgi:hypothetical protein